MTTISASEELYELSSREALSWLEKAQGQRYCAKILKDHLLQMVGDKTPAWTRRVETLEVVSSALLLVGLAVENLIKGVYVARNPGLVDRKRLDRSLWQSDGGHGITDFAKDVMRLTPEEEELLDRLQEYTVWADRFPIPTKSGPTLSPHALLGADTRDTCSPRYGTEYTANQLWTVA
jgi:hypothetical protein